MFLNSLRRELDNEVQAILEEAIARRPKEPTVPKPPSMFSKLFYWFLAQKASVMKLRVVVINSDAENQGYWVGTRKGAYASASYGQKFEPQRRS